MKIKIALTLATWFGSGNLKPASGTWGTLAAFPLSFTCAFYGGLTLLIPMILILFFVGLWAAHIYEVEKNEHDCSHVVIDEACGITIAVIPIIIDPS
jgi:phosphatidylglycerophosphatase A